MITILFGEDFLIQEHIQEITHGKFTLLSFQSPDFLERLSSHANQRLWGTVSPLVVSDAKDIPVSHPVFSLNCQVLLLFAQEPKNLLTKLAKQKNKSVKKASEALEFENAAIECLVYKTARAVEKYKIKTLIVAGGVAANKHLRNEMKKVTTAKAGQAGKKIKLLFPTQELSGDNSLMIGIAGYLNYIKNKNLPAGKAGKVPKLSTIKATGDLRL